MKEGNRMITCPECESRWPWLSEQAVCIGLFDECFICRFTSLTGGSGEGTLAEAKAVEMSYNERVGDRSLNL